MASAQGSRLEKLSTVHKGNGEEDTCLRNIWANQAVMRSEVTASAIHGEPPELGSSYSCGGICEQEQGSPKSQVMLHAPFSHI